MKKKFVMLVMGSLLTFGSYAQDQRSNDFKELSEYNKWSIDGGIGLTKPYNRFSPGYSAASPGFLATELGARYMINNLFGVKLGLGYNRFSEGDNSPSFRSEMFRVDLQGVTNVGRLLKFEQWTRTFGMLAHAGVGIGRLSFDSNIGDDNIAILTGGITGQIRMSSRVALNLDASVSRHFKQGTSFDGMGSVSSNDNGPVVFNGTIGISYYIGRKSTHADWHYVDKIGIDYNLHNRLVTLESDMQQMKRDLMAKSDVNVDNINRRIDELNNKISTVKSADVDYSAFVSQLINDGFVNIFFDFNSTRIDNTAANAISIIRTYMMKNPGVNAKLTGFADEIGPEEFNKQLSLRRAEAVADLLVKTGISRSRLETEGKGEYTNVDKSSDVARRQARRVSFSIK